MKRKKKALIIGCGIAGPAAAMMLKRAGCEPVVYEAQPEPDDYAGLFLNVGLNGIRVLEELGADAFIRKEGFEMRTMSFWNGKGKRLGQLVQSSGEPHGYTVKRGVLHKALREEAERQGIPIRFGCRLADIRMSGNRVEAVFRDGSADEGDFLVGCDGLHSAVRSIILPGAAQPSYTGLISFGGYARGGKVRHEPGVQHLVFGSKAFFGYLVQEDGEIYWFGNIGYPGTPTRRDLQAIPQAEWRGMIRDLYAGDAEPVPDIIRRTDTEIGVYPIYDMPSQNEWHRGLAVLAGDAIHATSPNAGQGAALALEDAMALALCIRDIENTERAFSAFQRMRRERVERIVRYSRSIGQRKHATHPVQTFFRDLMLPLFLKSASKRSHDWMYGYRLDWNRKLGGDL
ncbi:aromatic-ring hydroxylase (flavoprotein monooxygenase) signature protein [Paenibacillus sp. 32O-W]|uniref:FAD-dependent oxidoreductase n=1 Tax=Paenibacillus sp. 32O-W TaxID=1695218 RepID=UPI000721AAF1|nr:NAD(P)/FAD-dependent oxidoreductase [Paenibacillus sp. 32O-W]ALS29297.1 aromatic-ring hydroxylase (flavoprotein monooxygenase) signature protein [Paenibacillus sp. 32O-W]